MKLEELIVAIDASTLDGEAYTGIVEILTDKLLKGYPTKAKEHLTVLETCKEDMNIQFKDEQKILAGINEFTDDQMEHIARDVEDQLIEYYWDALELAVEAELEATEGK